MERSVFTFILGAILSLFLPVVPVLFGIIFSGWLFIYRNKYLACRLMLPLMLGITWILLSVNTSSLEKHSQNMFLKQYGQNLVIQGEILTITASKTHNKQRFNMFVTHINQQPIKEHFTVRLSWKTKEVKLFQGQSWQLKVKLKPSHGFGNLGGFSYPTWLRYHDVIATGYVVDKPKAKLKPEHLSNILIAGQVTLRQELYNKAQNLIQQQEHFPLLLALSFGERVELTPLHKNILQNTSTQHLIAISGLHLGFVALSSFTFALYIFKWLPLCLLPSNVQIKLIKTNLRLFAVIFSLIITVFYAYCAGFSLPTFRALIMIFLYWLCRVIGVNLTLFQTFLWVVFFILIFHPLSLLSLSFWLSFGAVFLIFIIYWRFDYAFREKKLGRLKLHKGLISLLILQLAFSICMLPLTLMINNQLSFLSLAANLIAVPVISLFILPLCLLALCLLFGNESLSMFFFDVAHSILSGLWSYLEMLNEQRWAYTHLLNQDVFILSVIIVLIMLYILFRIRSKQIIYAFLFFLIVPLATNRLILGNDEHLWKVTTLDVGQGLAIVINTGDGSILYDTGASYPSGFNMVEAVILPYARHENIKSFERVIISHNDNDHAGGLKNLINEMPKVHVVANDLRLSGDSFCSFPHRENWRGLSFTYLWPHSIMQGDKNDDSCVIKISDGKRSILLTGDISKKVENKLVQAHIDNIISLDSDVLIAPHHGSSTSSSEAFINMVSPTYVVFSAGYLNRWHMPTSKVRAAYAHKNINMFSTAEDGLIEFSFYSNNYKVRQYYQDIWPYWFAQ